MSCRKALQSAATEFEPLACPLKSAIRYSLELRSPLWALGSAGSMSGYELRSVNVGSLSSPAGPLCPKFRPAIC